MSEKNFSIFILKSKSDALKSTETFLRNRHWTVGSATGLREALAYIIQKQPEFILIAADHPNKKVRGLPALLGQAFPGKIIAYAESQSGNSMALLHELGVEYSIFPPMSGPSLERMILKIQKDDERKARDAQSRKEKGLDKTANTNETIMLKGKELDADSSQKTFEQARSALAQFISSDPDNPLGEDTYVEKGMVTEKFSEWDMGVPQNAFQVTTTEETAGKAPGAPVFEQAPDKKRSPLVPSYKRDPAKYGNSDSIIVKGTQQALEESVIVRDNLETYQAVEKSSNCACIVVESDRFSGYLVAVMGKDRKIDRSFIDLVKTRLFAFLKASGEMVRDEDTMSIKIQEVEFEDWAIEQAEFLRKSIHDGNEVAMAFFPAPKTDVALEESASEDMLAINIDDLKEDVPLEFDLYVYMPENKKYLLYTPQGRPLYGVQKNRLQEKGIKNMHLRKDSAQDVKKYQAQNYLNEKIDTFKGKTKIKKA